MGKTINNNGGQGSQPFQNACPILDNSTITFDLDKEYRLSSYYSFCAKHNLDSSNICAVLNGRLKHHKGWTGKYFEE